MTARSNQPDTIGTVLKDLLRRMKIAETAPQLTKASIKDGALRVLDAAFGVRVKLGRLDGDFDADGEPDWGLAIFDAAGDLVFLGTKAGLFVKGIVTASIITGSTISGSTVTGGTIQTDTPPNPRVVVTDAAPSPYDAAVQFFQGTEPAGAQGFIAQYLDPFTAREILGLGPSGLAGVGYPNRALIFLVSRKADGSGDREILLYAGERLTVDADKATFSNDVDVYGDLDVFQTFKVNAVPTRGTVKSGRFVGTTNGAGDLVIPHGLGSLPVGISLTMDWTYSLFGAAFVEPKLENYDATNLNVRIVNTQSFAPVAGQQFGVWWMVSNL